jgi:hypothetical protein
MVGRVKDVFYKSTQYRRGKYSVNNCDETCTEWNYEYDIFRIPYYGQNPRTQRF